jgi:hypothetical protein
VQLPTDSIRDVVRAVFTRPEYQWMERRQPLHWLFQLIGRFLDWVNQLTDRHPVGSTVLVVVASVILVLVLAHIGYTLWGMFRVPARSGAQQERGVGPIHDAAWHLARSETLAREGRYAEALGHRFLAVVLELDRVAALRFHVSKTPAEYLMEVRLDPAGRASFGALVGRLYGHLFGGLPCSDADYREFGGVAQELMSHVVPA